MILRGRRFLGGLVRSAPGCAPFPLAIIRIFHKSPARFEANHGEAPRSHHGRDCWRNRIMMSLPFVLFACGLGAAWLRQRAAAMGFWVAGLVILLVLFRAHYGDALSIAL
jgi:hypothetical protein